MPLLKKHSCLIILMPNTVAATHEHNEILAHLKCHWCMTFADCRPQTADCRRRPQIADCKLNDTKNPPNKGDVFKNIKSCKSSLGNKVDIFVQSYIGLIPKMLLAILHRPFINSPGISLIALILYSSLIIVN